MKCLTKKVLLAAVLVFCFASVGSAGLAERIDGIIRQPSQRKVRFSISIVEGGSGETVYSHKGDVALVPASNMKIVVTAAALKYLGPDYEYKTKVGLCGDTLVVIGSGDPLLGDKTTDDKYGREEGWIFRDIAAALKQNGIVAIKDIVVDSGVFDDERVHPNWPKEQLNRWYACEVSGLNFNDNCIDVTTQAAGGKVAVIVEPKTTFVEVISKVVPVSKGKSGVGAYRTQVPNRIIVKGKCKKQEGPFAVAIERPAAFFGHLLAERLAEGGIEVRGQLCEKEAVEGYDVKVLKEYRTSIKDCLARCNKNSLGLAAEALLKTIAANANAGAKGGSWTDGREAISLYLLGLGVEGGEFYIDDGSGLSRENKLSARAITRVLLDIYKSRDWAIYRDSLAVGGTDGTIGKYFGEEKYKGKVLGKTGYIAGVRSFSGVCILKGGDYIFSILTNKSNYKTRRAINEIAEAIIDSSEGGG